MTIQHDPFLCILREYREIASHFTVSLLQSLKASFLLVLTSPETDLLL
jgi:uncharacterized membrane protein YesL